MGILIRKKYSISAFLLSIVIAIAENIFCLSPLAYQQIGIG